MPKRRADQMENAGAAEAERPSTAKKSSKKQLQAELRKRARLEMAVDKVKVQANKKKIASPLPEATVTTKAVTMKARKTPKKRAVKPSKPLGTQQPPRTQQPSENSLVNPQHSRESPPPPRHQNGDSNLFTAAQQGGYSGMDQNGLTSVGNNVVGFGISSSLEQPPSRAQLGTYQRPQVPPGDKQTVQMGDCQTTGIPLPPPQDQQQTGQFAPPGQQASFPSKFSLGTEDISGIQDEDEDSESTKTICFAFLLRVFLQVLLVVIAVLVLLAFLVSALAGSSLVRLNGRLPSHCLDGVISSTCIDYQCPSGGICDECRIVGCSNDHYEVWGDEICILKKRANETIEVLRSLLVNKTISDQCGGSPSKAFPLFSYNDLQKEMPSEEETYHLDALVLAEIFVLDTDEHGNILIGLHEDQSLSYSGSCLLKMFIGWCGNFILTVIKGAGTHMWNLISSHPIPTFFVAILVFLLYRWWSNQARQEKIRQDVEQAWKQAIKFLQAHADKVHEVIHVRDEIFFRGSPHLSDGRTFFNEEIWPRVMGLVKGDNRIQNLKQVREGIPIEFWQWVAAPSSK